MLYTVLSTIGGEGTACVLVYLLAAGAMAVPIFFFDFWSTLAAFLLLEGLLGMFNSCGAVLRSRYYPERVQSSVMSVFRLPLNLLVALGTRLADQADSSKGPGSLKFVFAVVVGMLLIATCLQLMLISSDVPQTVESAARPPDSDKKKKKKH